MFEITLICLLCTHIYQYFKLLDDNYMTFKIALISICAVMTVMCLISMGSTLIMGVNQLNEYIGVTLMGISSISGAALLLNYFWIAIEKYISGKGDDKL